MQVTRESLELAIDKVREGNRLFDICGTVEQYVVKNGFSSYGSLSGMESEPSFMRSRRFPTM